MSSIWQYDSLSLSRFAQSDVPWLYGASTDSSCRYCKSPMDTVLKRHCDSIHTKLRYSESFHFPTLGAAYNHDDKNPETKPLLPRLIIESQGKLGRDTLYEDRINACPSCGWWVAFSETISENGSVNTYGGIGALRELDLSDVRAPLDEVRSYLMAKYDARFSLDPRSFENVVGSVFGDLGFRSRVTNYSRDGGIDVILDGPKGEVIGVQVKRYRDTIGVDQIRELIGAMVIGGLTKGIFVTTSRFTSGADETVELAASERQIALCDAKRFYDALQLAQREKYQRDNVSDLSFFRANSRHLTTRTPPQKRGFDVY